MKGSNLQNGARLMQWFPETGGHIDPAVDDRLHLQKQSKRERVTGFLTEEQDGTRAEIR